ncbi:MAG: DUF6600 domain-containing protein [Candidatus Acidiferrales bacterium]
MRNRLGTSKTASTLVGPVVVALLLALASLWIVPRTAAAQDDAAQADPPGRVARLNYIQGSVSLQPAGTQDWIDANPNRPLTTGDNLWADQDARGELHVGSSVLRLSGQTGVSFLNLNDQITQLQLAQGSLYVRVRQLDEGEAFEIDTPNLAFSILRPGQYRVDVDPNGGSTMIAVWGGSGSVTGGGQAFTLNPGQEFMFSGTDQLTYDSQPLGGRDDFDDWCFSRDQREDHSTSARYVSRDVIGYNDLDDYGTWSNDPEYGAVWIPRDVDADWAPYHDGHWVYIAPWGWTWVEDEPWGFAPFHYGRWAVIGGRWGWVPGPVAVVAVGGPIVRPMYAPALVGFVGGGGFSLSIAIGGGAGVAWFPLGPRDVWVPSYRCSPVYVQHVNVYNTRVVNVTQVTTVYNRVYVNHDRAEFNRYTYANNVRAVTAVDHDTFVNGRPVGRASVRISQEQIRNPRVMQQTEVQPTQRSSFGGQANARVRPPETLVNRRIVTKIAPAPNAVPIGHTQPLGRGSNGTFGGQRGNQPGNQQVHQPNGNPGNANQGGRGNAQPNNENNNPRPGFRPFQPPNSNTNTNGGGNNRRENPGGNPPSNRNAQSNSNAQPNNHTQPTIEQPPQNGGNAPSDRNAQPRNNVRPFHPPAPNNGNANGNGNANPNVNRNNERGNGTPPAGTQPNTAQPNNAQPRNEQPSNNVRPAFHPPAPNNSNTNGNGNANPNFNRNNERGNATPPANAQPNNAQPRNQQPTFRPPSRNNENSGGNGNGGANGNVNRGAGGNPRPNANENNSHGGFQPPPRQQTEAKPPQHNNPPPKESKPPKKDDGKDHKD